ncbi:MAG: tetratricopeptide repeat protein [Deltaproteobacteria bacterium]|nr:tetratricopeptide repeat protein [Deltaproteobacteria bacterium]
MHRVDKVFEVLAVAVACALLLGASAHGGAPQDFDDKAASGRSFWARVSHPHRARYLSLLEQGQQLVEARRFDEALKLLQEAVSLETKEPEGHYWLARALLGMDRWSECAEENLRILRLDPEFTPPVARPLFFDIGVCLAMSGRIAESVPYYQSVLHAARATPSELSFLVMAHWNLGDSFHALGRLEEAIEEYRRGLALRPQHVMLHFALGVALDRDEQAQKAQDVIQAGLRLDTSMQVVSLDRMDSFPVLFLPAEDKEFYLGLVHKVAKRRTLARLYFRRYIERAREIPWARRAREHLSELGGAELGEAEVETRGVGLAERGPLVRAVLAKAQELHRCMDGQPLGKVVVEIALGGEDPERRRPRGKVTCETGIAPDPAHKVVDEALACVEKQVRAIRLPPLEGSPVITFPVVAR